MVLVVLIVILKERSEVGDGESGCLADFGKGFGICSVIEN